MHENQQFSDAGKQLKRAIVAAKRRKHAANGAQAAEKLRLGSGWEGHDFSRAVKSFKTKRASAPAGCLRHQSEFFSSLASRG